MIRKHSATLHGHRTSFSLEEPFWVELKSIAARRGMPLAVLLSEIDDSRPAGSNLSSALRVYVLEAVRAQIREMAPPDERSG
ncbi:MAG TPA: ribbon-helix-helix domain-containing protein [Mycoplana sp.]|nr:ribbon-helix-helix domain-containing protein [Mycoplana sp.]